MRLLKVPTKGNDQGQKGFTLTELMITMVVLAVGVALAVPTYEDVMQRRQTTSQAERLASFLSYAQSEAMKSNQEVSIELKYTSSSNWCIGANEGSAGCDCTEVDDSKPLYCSLAGVDHMMDASSATRSGMAVAPGDKMFTFDPIRGIMLAADLGSDHQFTMQSDNTHYQLRVDVAATGRITLCNPTSDKAVHGFSDCPVVVVPDPDPTPVPVPVPVPVPIPIPIPIPVPT